MKGKRIPNENEPNDLEVILPILRAFVQNPDFPVESKPELHKSAPIDYSDKLFELVPEAYLDSKPVDSKEIRDGIEFLIRENIAFKIRSSKDENLIEKD